MEKKNQNEFQILPPFTKALDSMNTQKNTKINKSIKNTLTYEFIINTTCKLYCNL